MVSPAAEPAGGASGYGEFRRVLSGQATVETEVDEMSTPASEISRENRDRLITMLNERLADGIDLMLRSKLAHWHAEGPDYYALAGLFDRVYADVAEHVDLIAERAVQLGGRAKGGVAHVARSTRLPAYDEDGIDAADQLSSLTNTLVEYLQLVRDTGKHAETLGDRDTAEIFAGVSRDLDTHVAFLHGHFDRPEEAGA
jgi:starvation-inducible DNA-binding protein